MIIANQHHGSIGVLPQRWQPNRSRAYVLLETVIATGLLVVGLAVIGAQIQDSDTTIRNMELKIRAMHLSQMHLAKMSLGLIDFESVDDIEEEDFGPRYPKFGWRVTHDETAIVGLKSMTLEILHRPLREDDDETFEFDDAPVLFTLHTLQAAPEPLDLTLDFGLPEDQLEELSTKFADLGIEGLDPMSLDPTILAKLDFEDFMRALPLLLEAFGMDVGDLAGSLPPSLREMLESTGTLEDPNQEGEQRRGGS